jgi:hypothetical protein
MQELLSSTHVNGEAFYSVSVVNYCTVYRTSVVRSTFTISKGGRTSTASRQASRHETKKTKADVSIMTQTGVRRFS